MTGTGKFSAETIQVLSKRAALQCSNPDCGILTHGPDTGNGIVNIGEAAHIYGRLEDAARYKPDMTPTERADITNGIWLCRNCHKEVDSDVGRFSAELLFAWRREHEKTVIERVGLKGDIIRERLKAGRLKSFEGASDLAQQIVLDRPPFWEYKLVAEILRSELVPIHKKWTQLKNKLYVKKSTIISADELTDWWRTKFGDLSKVVTALARLLSDEMPKAWGEPGVAGDDIEILHVCQLIISVANNLLEWEEDIQFSSVPDGYEAVQNFLQGTSEDLFDELQRVPKELSKIFEQNDPQGEYHINIAFRVPERFTERLEETLSRVRKARLLQELEGKHRAI